MNTMIYYLYRDASNYKVNNMAVVEGELTEKQISEIIGTLEDGEHFVPHQVGLPEKKFDDTTEDDLDWFELYEDGFEPTKAVPTVKITAQELYEAFLACKGYWLSDSHCWDPKTRKVGGLPPKYRCPKCGGFRFAVTAHVTQDWEVDDQGQFVRCTNDCVEVTHSPDMEDLWGCVDCGYSAEGKEFLVENQKK